jgi:hypothetical protein
VAMLAIGLATVTPVKAEHVDAKLNYGHIWGDVTVHKDVVDWKLNLRDTKPNNRSLPREDQRRRRDPATTLVGVGSA